MRQECTIPFHGLEEAASAILNERFEVATPILKAALQMEPKRWDIWMLLAHVQLEQGALQSHQQAMSMALRLNPKHSNLLLKAALSCPPMMTTTKEIERTRQQISFRLDKLSKAANQIDPFHAHSALCFPLKNGKMLTLEYNPTLNFYPVYHGKNDCLLNTKLFELLEKIYPVASPKLNHIGRPQNSSLRVGFFSLNLRDHTIGHLFGGIAPRLDKNKFHSVFFTIEGINCPKAKEWANACDEAHVVPKNIHEAIDIISSTELDILVYTDIGMDSFVSFLAMHRMATVQCTTWGHPVTTGIPNIDVFFSMDYLEPLRPGPYSEVLITQKKANIFYTQPQIPRDADKNEFKFPTGRLYGCPQTLFKFHPDFDDTLIGLLREDPDATLVLLAGKQQYWRTQIMKRLRAKEPTIDNRVHWLPGLKRTEYLKMLHCLDVMIDPYPFGGGNTTLEALAMGTPVVTRPPQLARGRLAAAFYNQMNYTELIVNSAEEMIKKCIEMAKPGDARDKARAEIAQKRGVLFENMQGVKEFEVALEKAHQIGLAKFRQKQSASGC